MPYVLRDTKNGNFASEKGGGKGNLIDAFLFKTIEDAENMRIAREEILYVRIDSDGIPFDPLNIRISL